MHDFKICSYMATSWRPGPGTRDNKIQPNLTPPLEQTIIRHNYINKSKSDLVANNLDSWGSIYFTIILLLFSDKNQKSLDS
jgi:hypothetical protein